MNYRRPSLIILLFIYPHSLECWKRSQYRSSKPNWVLPLRWSQYLDLVSRWCQWVNLLPHSLSHSLKQSRSSRQNNILKQISPHIIVTLHNWVIAVLLHSFKLVACMVGLEQYLWASESLVSYKNLPPVWQFVVLLTSMRLVSFLHGCIEVSHHITHLLLNVSDYFQFSSSCKRVTSLS